VQHFEEFRDVVEVQAGGRFVEDVEGFSGRLARQFLGEFYALRLGSFLAACRA